MRAVHKRWREGAQPGSCLLPHGRDGRRVGACDGVNALLLGGILPWVGVCSTRSALSTSHIEVKQGLIRQAVGAVSHGPLTTCEDFEVTWSLRRWRGERWYSLAVTPRERWHSSRCPRGRRRESSCAPLFHLCGPSSLSWNWSSLMVCPPSPWTSVSHIAVLPVHVRSPPRRDT